MKAIPFPCLHPLCSAACACVDSHMWVTQRHACNANTTSVDLFMSGSFAFSCLRMCRLTYMGNTTTRFWPKHNKCWPFHVWVLCVQLFAHAWIHVCGLHKDTLAMQTQQVLTFSCLGPLHSAVRTCVDSCMWVTQRHACDTNKTSVDLFRVCVLCDHSCLDSHVCGKRKDTLTTLTQNKCCFHMMSLPKW